MRHSLRNLIRGLRLSNNKITQSEAKFQAFIKYAGDSIFIVDPTYRVTEMNESACKLLNYSSEELHNMKIYELMTEDDHESFVDRTKIIDKEGGSLHERKLKRKDGS